MSQDINFNDTKARDAAVVPDPLDATRIHPEDYELARKMAAGALELDDEDIADLPPSHVITQITQDIASNAANSKKLDDLNLDEFADNLFDERKERKRHILTQIRDELVHPFRERRGDFVLPNEWEVLTMLSGETSRTLRNGRVVSVFVQRITKHAVYVKLDSGIEGSINPMYLTDQPVQNPDKVVQKGQTIPAVITKVEVAFEKISLELSGRPNDITRGEATRRIQPEICYDKAQEARDKDVLNRKKNSTVDRARRVVKHPLFHNFNSNQAEKFLSNQQRGDLVIRPSSKGADHLAITWKIADGVYQHIGQSTDSRPQNIPIHGLFFPQMWSR